MEKTFFHRTRVGEANRTRTSNCHVYMTIIKKGLISAHFFCIIVFKIVKKHI